MNTYTMNIPIPDYVLEMMQDIEAAGGTCYVVGGTIRDAVMGKVSKDYDIECYGIDGNCLETVLRGHGIVRTAGKHFGVFKVFFEASRDIVDVSLARRENKVGKGHDGFRVMPDPKMSLLEAAMRRDFTINSFFYNPFSSRIIDLFGGKEDIKRRLLRAISPAFKEDPLRVLRGMRFAGQFAMEMENDTANMCFDLREEYTSISRERVWGEWSGMLEKSIAPSKAMKVLEDTGWIYLYPEITRMIGLEQDKIWHPEGDCWTHTKHVMDEAARIARRDGLDAENTRILVLSALCHDMGKPDTTFVREDGRIVSPAHAKAGVKYSLAFMASIGTPESTAAQVAKLVQEHMVIAGVKKPSDKAVIKLANRVAPSNIEMLCKIIEADESGRPPLPKAVVPYFLEEQAQRLSVREEPQKPFLMGRDILALGVKPGPHIGTAIKWCQELQEEGKINSHEEAVVWAKEVWLESFLSVFI